MSVSELSTPVNVPADDEIEQALRNAVHRLNKKHDEVTVNKARSLAEKELDLDDGFFKSVEGWKVKSKAIIQDAVEQGEEAPSPEKPVKRSPSSRADPPGRKRKSDEALLPNVTAKRVRKSKDGDDEWSGRPKREVATADRRKARSSRTAKERNETDADDDLEESDPDEQDKTAKPVDSHSLPANEEESELSSLVDEAPAIEKNQGTPGSTNFIGGAQEEHDDSDMSSLIDEPPAKKKRQKTTDRPAKAKVKPSKQKPKAGKDSSPADEEVKRLQGWLVKCGIRKMWAKELAPYSSSKEKINHLKKMLEDAGMTGRYSNEKASQIKESRELAAELEAVEEFNERWGQSDNESNASADNKDRILSTERAATGRRRPKGFIDFGDSGDDGSE